MSTTVTLSKEQIPVIKEKLVDILKHYECNIVFTNRNNELLQRTVTLREDIVPPYKSKTGRHKQPKVDVIPIWDTDLNEWRSFKIDNLIELEYEDGEVTVSEESVELSSLN